MTTKTEKHMVKERIREVYLDIWDFDGDLDEVIERLKEIQDKYAGSYAKLELDTDSTYEGLINVDLYGHRPENEKEKKRRLEKEAKAKAEKARQLKLAEQQEWEEYERLKKKFGD